IERNVARLSAEARSEIRAGAVERMAAPREPFHLVFMDPPYNEGLAQPALHRLAGDAWVGAGGWISVEKGPEPLNLPDGLAIEAERRFGKAHLLLLRQIAGPGAAP
ncbi:MAG: RsmD family RNA methyltransferase, partial [Allosphingosinicella sp.]